VCCSVLLAGCLILGLAHPPADDARPRHLLTLVRPRSTICAFSAKNASRADRRLGSSALEAKIARLLQKMRRGRTAAPRNPPSTREMRVFCKKVVEGGQIGRKIRTRRTNCRFAAKNASRADCGRKRQAAGRDSGRKRQAAGRDAGRGMASGDCPAVGKQPYLRMASPLSYVDYVKTHETHIEPF
jgi:hypothetical protein